MPPTNSIRIIQAQDTKGPSDPVRIANWTAFIDAVVTEILTTGGTNLAQQVFVSLTGDDSTGEVGNAGAPFRTIQGAIDAITDASVTKPYVVSIGAGTFTENIVGKGYVALLGTSIYTTILNVVSGNLLSIDGGVSADLFFVSNVWMQATVVAGATTFINATNNPQLILQRVRMDLVVPAPFAAKFINGSFAGLGFDNLNAQYIGLYNAPVSQDLFDLSGGTMLAEDSSIVAVGNPQPLGDITIIKESFTTNVLLSGISVLSIFSAPYSGTLRVLDSTGTALKTINSNEWSLSGNGGTVEAIRINSAGSTTLFTSSSLIAQFWATSTISNVSAADALLFTYVNAGGMTVPFTGAGAVNRVITLNNVFTVNTAISDENLFLSGSTNTTLQAFFNITASSGWVSGGALTDNGDGTIDIAAGTGFVRTANTEQSDLKMFDWSATAGLSLTNNAWNYVIVRYNAGSPDVIVQASIPNENDEFELYEIYRSGTSLQIEDHKHRALNTSGKIQDWLYSVFALNVGVEDAQLGETGTRNVTISGGASLWVKLNEITTSAFDTSGADTFRRYYDNGAGGWTEQSGQTQWNNTQYDDTSGILQNIGVNRYSWQDFYMLGDESVVSFFGTSNEVQLADAVNAPRRTGRPAWANDEHSVYIGRIVFQQAGGTATLILQRGD